MNLFIASEVRSGSTYIAESLAYSFSDSFKVDFWDAGKELFNQLSDSTDADQIESILSSLGQNSIGIKCAKIMCASLSIICREVKRNPELYDHFFGQNACWIIIRRRNRIKQAVSLATAIASDTWHFYDDPKTSPDNKVSISNESIYDALKMIILSDDYLENFSHFVEKSTTIYYEDFIGNELEVLKNTINKLGLPFDEQLLTISPAKLKKTGQPLKSEAERAFREYLLENYHQVE
ncbi:LPS sulfotransferase NodH [Massilia sp. MP_M2]|uniref:Stf0 family sulfotransferase n=1 Tax=Massilia sp. MP_M2 TaxID=3071713 RepID=UPI00319D8B8D